ncbi:DM9 repeat-containing protein [Burkholderia sp. Ac-20365]|jgi:hypothetical protein|uniref:DM9 repeat-containing protein n=1 Tax=Burkholderia sp. Ac-20365 TaxID=2703897 RepID=UPI00197BBD31|nr:DM9 repeat-containing protein [Burkholderia sp. Ac-20365]MBN3760746.1 DUF3421 domain-containing protein [Burkholderia sp. Ac-20365]
MNRLIAVCGWCMAMVSSSAAELPAGSHWIKAGQGQVPAGAIALGREVDGRPQFSCRAQQGNGVSLGAISAGSGGCRIGFAGRALTVANYEVLAAGAAPAVQAASRLGARSGILADKAIVVPRPGVAGSAPAIDASGSVRRGFDAAGRPYVEARKADGTVVRKFPNGSQVTYPDGKQEFFPAQHILSNAQMPTPPELPADPQRGRLWLDQHNAALLEVIRTMVRRDESEMQKFSDAERKEAGTDVYRQIGYRTKIAEFLAAGT